MTEDFSAERGPAGESWQTAMLHKRLNANDGVVTPIIAVGALQPGEAVDVNRPIYPGRKLLHPGEQGVAADQKRRNLDEPGPRIVVHQRNELRERAPAHQAIGIEHYHVLVQRSPVHAEVSNITTLAADVTGAISIIDASIGVGPTQAAPSALLICAAIGVLSIAQHEEIEVMKRTNLAQRLFHCLDSGKNGSAIFVVNWNSERCPRVHDAGL